MTATDIGSGKTVVFVQSANGAAARVEQGPVRARAVGHDRRRARARVGGAADPVPGGLRRRALLLRRRPAPEHAAVAGAAPRRRQGAGDRPAPQAARRRTSPRSRCRFRARRSWSARSWTPSCSITSTTTSIACAASTPLIEAVRAIGSPEHSERFDEVVTDDARRPLPDRRRVHDPAVGRPGRDRRTQSRAPADSRGAGGGAGIQLLRRLATARGADEADLLSYILFDGLYAAEVARIGLRGRARPPRRAGQVPRRRRRPRVDATPTLPYALAGVMSTAAATRPAAT